MEFNYTSTGFLTWLEYYVHVSGDVKFFPSENVELDFSNCDGETVTVCCVMVCCVQSKVPFSRENQCSSVVVCIV